MPRNRGKSGRKTQQAARFRLKRVVKAEQSEKLVAQPSSDGHFSADCYEKDWDLGYYACYQAQFFNDKLSVVGGLRWDRVDSTKDVSYPYANSLIGSTFTDGKLVTYGKATEHYNTDEAATAYSPSIGLNYSVTDWLSVYGVYSTGVTPNFYAYDGNGEMLDPTEAENVEFGVKFDAFDGKLSGTFSYYQIKRTGSPYNLWWAPNPTAIATSGFDADSSLSALAMYYTPTAFATMFQSTDFDGDGVADEHTTAYYQKVLDTLKSNWPSGWWPYFTEIYDYCVANPTAWSCSRRWRCWATPARKRRRSSIPGLRRRC